MTSTYLASVLTAPNQVEVREEAERTLAAGEVRLRVAFAGICGTDVAIYSGDYPVPLPLTLGHEFSGIVHEVQDKAHENLVGQRVVGEINNSCLAYGRNELCAACRRGLPTHCLTRTVTGIINHPGAFAECLNLPANSLHVIPPEIELDQAVLLEPLAAALRTFELSPIVEGDTVVVLGCGRLGRLIALVASKAGARVIAVGRSREHLHLMEPFAAVRISYQAEDPEPGTFTITGTTELRALVLEQTEGLGADVVVEATASNENLVLAQELVRPLGTVALKSTCGRPVPQLDTTFSAVHEIRFQGSRCGPFDKAIAFMQEHELPSQQWITRRFSLREVAAAIEAARREPKVVLEITP